MKIKLLILFLFVAAPVFSQTSTAKGLTVNGLALGASYQEVVKKLGKPARESNRKADECVGGIEKTLAYPGLKLKLWDDPQNPKKFTVGEFEVTSAKWDVSGARVGEAQAAIKKRFGTRSNEETDPDTKMRVWYYQMNEEESPGSSGFYFRNGRVTKITSAWLMC